MSTSQKAQQLEQSKGEEDPSGFPFPFPPYPVQLDVMREIRSAIMEQRTVVIESPTGTGKSHMLLNGVLSTVFGVPSSTSPTGGSEMSAIDKKKNNWPSDRIVRCRQRPPPEPPYRRKKRLETTKGNRNTGGDGVGEQQQQDHLLLSQSSDSEEGSDGSKRKGRYSSSSSSSVSSDSDANTTRHRMEKDQRYVTKPKVFFASRTHSQLSQLVEAFTQTVFLNSNSSLPGEASSLEQRLSYVQLASRQQLCVNASYRAASQGSSERLSERCREALRYGKTKEGHKLRKLFLKEHWKHKPQQAAGDKPISLRDVEDLGGGARGGGLYSSAPTNAACLEFCPYSAPSKVSLLVEHMRASPKSQDELRQLGASIGACPFLASRELLREASVVFLPYSYLTDPKVRQATLSDIAGWEAPSDNERAAAALGHGDGVTNYCQVDESEYDFSGDVVVFDEAHNVADSTRAAKSAALSEAHCQRMVTALQFYAEKFQDRLLAKNKAKIRGIVSFVSSLARFMAEHRQKANLVAEGDGNENKKKRAREDGDSETEQQQQCTYRFSQFTFAAGVDNVNVFPLVDFLHSTHLLQKLPSVYKQQQQQQQASGLSSGSRLRSPATSNNHSEDLFMETRVAGWALESFLKNFADADSDCVVICRPCPTTSPTAPPIASSALYELKLLSLAPWRGLLPVSSRARSLIFAGGTMHPLSLQLDPILPPLSISDDDETTACAATTTTATSRYDAFTFGHVVPAASLRVFTLGKGPSGRVLELTHRNRHQRVDMLSDIALTVLNLLRVIPDGVIVCFTSYRMEQEFVEHCEATGMMDQIQSVKKLFREPRNAGSGTPTTTTITTAADEANSLQAVLQEYTQFISAVERDRVRARTAAATSTAHTGPSRSQTGAMITCVMGGKLSEGINFNDALGRGVIVVGLPYASPDDEETNQLLSFAAAGSVSSTSSSKQKSNSAEVHGLASDLCMRSVNQSIGRCIRHVQDYACVVLLDARYKRLEIRERIAKWMQPSVVPCEDFGSCFRGVRQFFVDRQSN